MDTIHFMSLPTFKGLADLNRRLDYYEELRGQDPQPSFQCPDCGEWVFHLATTTKEYLDALDAHSWSCGT